MNEKIAAEIIFIKRTLEILPSQPLNELSSLELAGTASLIHSFYNGIENILKQLHSQKNLPIPSGSTWHRDLLDSSIRNGLVSEEFGTMLRPYLGFRHFFSHSYTLHLDYRKIEQLLPDMVHIFDFFVAEIDRA